MQSERFSLPFLAGVMLAALERKRPGLGAWSAATRKELEETLRAELATVRRTYFELFDDSAYWTQVERELTEVAFPRYCAVAERETALEQRDYGTWRGGDLVARATYAL